MTKTYIFNSLPRSGKDTAAKILKSLYQDKGLKVQHLSFKEKLIELSARFVGETVGEFMIGYDSKTEDMLLYDLDSDKTYPEWWKDFPLYHVNGKEMSKRELLIHVSENIIKPTFSQDFFGQQLASMIQDDTDVVVISDGGFVQELLPVLNVSDVTIVRINKKELTKVTDSRKLLTPDDFYDYSDNIGYVELGNDGTISDLANEIMDKLVKRVSYD